MNIGTIALYAMILTGLFQCLKVIRQNRISKDNAKYHRTWNKNEERRRA